MLEKIKLNKSNFFEEFDLVFNYDELELAYSNYLADIFYVYKGNNILLIIEYVNDGVHIVGLIGKNTRAYLDAIYAYCKYNKLNIYFKIRKNSLIRFYRKYNPIFVGYDGYLKMYMIELKNG